MKRLLALTAIALFGTAVISLPSGCGPGDAEKIDATKYQSKQPPGHDEAWKESEKGPN